MTHNHVSPRSELARHTYETGSMRRILVVDDERDVREVLRRALRRRGYAVETAENGAEALDLSKGPGFDAVLADLSMPELGGIDLVRHLRSTSPRTAIIVLSGHIGCLEGSRLRRMGVSEVLRKPVGMDRLLQVLRETGRGVSDGGATCVAAAPDLADCGVR